MDTLPTALDGTSGSKKQERAKKEREQRISGSNRCYGTRMAQFKGFIHYCIEGDRERQVKEAKSNKRREDKQFMAELQVKSAGIAMSSTNEILKKKGEAFLEGILDQGMPSFYIESATDDEL